MAIDIRDDNQKARDEIVEFFVARLNKITGDYNNKIEHLEKRIQKLESINYQRGRK